MDQQSEITRVEATRVVFQSVSPSIRSRLTQDATAIDCKFTKRPSPLPVASVCVGEHHVCVESPEHVAKTIAFNGGILNTDRRTVVLHPRYDYGSVNYM